MTTASTGTGGSTIVTQTRVLEEKLADYEAWQRRSSEAVARFPGFSHHEVIRPDPPIQSDWVSITRFESREHAGAWLESSTRAELVDEVEDLIVGYAAISALDDAGGPRTRAVTDLIRTKVYPGLEDAFRRWFQKIDAVQSKEPGFLGSTLQEPVPGVQDEWITILAFDSQQHLDDWTNSERRLALMAEAEPLMDERDVRPVASSFEGWFQLGRGEQGAPPPMWKLNLVILLTLYPIVMLTIIFINPNLEWMNIAFGNLTGNVLSVALLGWPLVTLVSTALRWWLQPPPDAGMSNDLKGLAVVVVALAVLVAVFYMIDTNVNITDVTEL